MFLPVFKWSKSFLSFIILVHVGSLYSSKFFLMALSWWTNAVVIKRFLYSTGEERDWGLQEEVNDSWESCPTATASLAQLPLFQFEQQPKGLISLHICIFTLRSTSSKHGLKDSLDGQNAQLFGVFFLLWPLIFLVTGNFCIHESESSPQGLHHEKALGCRCEIHHHKG